MYLWFTVIENTGHLHTVHVSLIRTVFDIVAPIHLKNLKLFLWYFSFMVRCFDDFWPYFNDVIVRLTHADGYRNGLQYVPIVICFLYASGWTVHRSWTLNSINHCFNKFLEPWKALRKYNSRNWSNYFISFVHPPRFSRSPFSRRVTKQ